MIIRRVEISTILLAVIITVSTASAEPNSKASALRCDIGPVLKIYGNTPWNVFSCNDHQSVVIVSAPGNPAMPFYFMFSRQKTGYHLSGEGNGRKEATAAAFRDLKKLTEHDINVLLLETKQR